MGGNAISDSKRISKSQYKQLYIEISNLVACHCKKFKIPPHEPEKQSHGDLDILVQNDKYLDIKEIFNSEEIVINGNLTSFNYKGYQIDVIYCVPESFDWQVFTYSYGYIKYILSLQLKQLDGVISDGFYIVHKGSSEHKKILMTRDPDLFCLFMQLDYDKFMKGFKTKKECFSWIRSTPFFQNINITSNKQIKLSKIKPMIEEYLTWITENPFTDRIIQKKEFTDMALDFFKKQIEYHNIDKEIERRRKISEKFNGDIITKYTELKGIYVGKLISNFKHQFNDDEILEMTDDDIRENILRIYNMNK